MKSYLKHIILGTIVLGALISMAYWISGSPPLEFSESVPGMDNRESGGMAAEAEIVIGEFYDQLAEAAVPALNETWPRFRGRDFDNISKSPIPLADRLPDETEILWRVELGEGHAGPAIYEGLVYLLDYEEESKSDMLRCFTLDEGKELWRRWYNVDIKRNHGMSRTVPAVTEDYILTMGPRSHVMCLERESGDLIWSLDIVKEYGTEIPFWYTGQCPLIDDGMAVLATGGSALLIGVDCRTGKVKWETPNESEWKMSHSSVMPYEFGGQKMYVYSAVGGVAGIAADGRNAGEILWSSGRWNHPVVAPSPVCMPDGKIFLTAGYGAGSMMLQLQEGASGYSLEILEEYSPKEGLACEQQTPLYYRDHLFGILPKDAGPLRNQLVCVHPSDCRKILWSSGQTVRFGLGPYMIADEKMFLLKDDGTLFLIDPETDGYRELSRSGIIDGHDAWAPLAIADGYLLLRDSKTMVCINIKA